MTALSGLEGLIGYGPDDVRGMVATAFSDSNSAYFAMLSAFAGLLERQRSGAGGLIDLSQTEAAVCMTGRPGRQRRSTSRAVTPSPRTAGCTPTSMRFTAGRPYGQARAPAGSGGQYPMTILPCRDRHVVLMSRSRAEWARYLEMMGHPAWAQDPELRDPAIIARHHADRVDTYVTEWLSTRTSSELTALAPLCAVPEVLTDVQLAHRHFFAAPPGRPDIALPTFPAVFTPSSGPGGPLGR